MTWRWHMAAASAAVVVLVLLIGPLYLSVAGELPFGPHEWKQSDCLAVAERFFEDESWNILDPRVLSRFPVDGRINFELPLAPWLASVAARLGGEGDVAADLRMITLLLSLLGPLALFVLVWSRTRSFLASFAPLMFLAGSPVITYYATSSLPDAAALGLCLTGLTVLLAGASPPSPRRQVFAVALMTLAGLVKMSFAPYLVVPAVLLWRRRKRTPGVPRSGLPLAPVLALASSAMVMVVQVILLKVREAAFAPTFCVAGPVPITSLDELAKVIHVMRREWLGDLFSVPQLVILAAALAVVVARRFARRRADDLTISSALAATVMVALFLLFGQQLAYHDYYAIAIVGPLAGLLVVRLALTLWQWREWTGALLGQVGLDLTLIAISLASALPLEPAFQRRTDGWWRSQNEWLRDARRDLDSCGERCAGPVGVLGSEPPNLALVYLDRRGYVLGTDLTSGHGATRLRTVDRTALFLDKRGVRVLVVNRELMKKLPLDQLRRDFVAVNEEGEGYVYVRSPS